MSTPRKIFIYQNDRTTSPQSIADIIKLFSMGNVFPVCSDIRLGNFQFNVTGLINPLFVIPGGGTIQMGCDIKTALCRIDWELKKQYDFLGICAGGFLATKTANILLASHERNADGSFQDPRYAYTLESPHLLADPKYSLPYNLDLITDHKAVGPFYPNNQHLSSQTEQFTPYLTKLRLSDSRIFSQLYVAGPAFIPPEFPEEKPSSQVVATYADNSYYKFFQQNGVQRFHFSPAAIISKKATATQGACLITGTHIEACVPDSKMLEAFRKRDYLIAPLDEKSFSQLETEREDTQKIVEEMLRVTFTR
jgi:glutamine amidotransferase-like uncharacterized protein